MEWAITQNKQHILAEIKRTATTNGGRPLGVRRFFAETGIKEFDWRGKFWTRWSDALQEAGYAPNEKQQAFDEAILIERLISLMRQLDKFPTKSDLLMKHHTDRSFPSAKIFERRFGSKQQLIAKVIQYCGERDSFRDILEFCEKVPIQSSSGISENQTQPNEIIIGHVYLMKSGRYYKIGRSNASGRREYELAIQMPEKITTIHTIRTDDPVGIEAYWHGRFETKRKNGEWFDLRGEDVRAFKRRKFM